MKKRMLALIMTTLLSASMLAGCASSQSGSATSQSTDQSTDTAAAAETATAETTGSAAEDVSADISDGGKVINIWSWNDEFEQRFNKYYPEVQDVSKDGTQTTLKDGTVVRWTINPNQNGVYQQKLDEALKNQDTADADDKIDLFLAETDYLVKYIDSDINVAVPLKALGIDPDTDMADQYQYTKDAATAKDGTIRATSWQACPGLFVYRRSIAKAVFGTDDPDQVQEKVKDWDTFENSAAELKDKGYKMLSSMGADTYRVFANNTSGKWVDDGSTVVRVDPNLMKWVAQSKEFTDKGYNNKVSGQWTDDWNKDQGADSKVFGWFFPAWGINFTIQPNTGDAGKGDWAVCQGPEAYNWGGSFLIACQGTDNASQDADIMKKLTMDKDILLAITNDTLDYTNTVSGMRALAEDDSYKSDFLGGENPYKYFAPAAESIKMDKITPYDQGCTECFQNAFGDYFNGQVSLDKAKENFETAIKQRYPELTSVEWPSD
ncbi:MAG TPA: ABC transporter substrate-binding protein [Lachnospiraceae bacterium]|nr:ABC transporter substrate-binding protein [Lachnospiraceae bacterium]